MPTDTTLHILNETTNIAGSALAIVSGTQTYTPITTKAFTATGPWNIIDLGPSFILLNSACTIFRLPAFGSVYCCFDHINLNAGAYHDKRLWFGGFSDRAGQSAFFTASRFVSVWDEYQAATSQLTEGTEVVDAAYLFYGSPMGGDVEKPFTAEMALFGSPNNAAFDVLKTHLFDAVRTGMMGFIRLALGGTVYRLATLGQQLIAYSSRGVELIHPIEGGGYATRILLRTGIPGPGAVAADEFGHTFVTNIGSLYQLAPDLKLQRFGYEEFFEDMASASDAADMLVVTHDPKYGDAYITDDSSGYVFSEKALTQLLDYPSSLVLIDTSILSSKMEEEELVTKGTFDSDASWTKGDTWSIGADKAHWAKKAGTLSQPSSLTVDRPHRLSYTISNWATGNSDANLYLSLGDQNGQVIEADGSYEDHLIPSSISGGLVVHPNTLSRGSIDNISLNAARRFTLTTGILQFNNSGKTTITAVELRGENLEGLQASAYWRNGASDTWRQTSWKRMGDRGMVMLNVTAKDIRVSIQGYLYDNQPDGSQRSLFDGLTLHYKTPDKSARRGAVEGGRR